MRSSIGEDQTTGKEETFGENETTDEVQVNSFFQNDDEDLWDP